MNDRLNQEARRDADRATPAFSEARHARLMDAVRSASPLDPAPPRLIISPWVPAVAAAVAFVSAGFFARWIASPKSTQRWVETTPQATYQTTLPSPPPQAYALLDIASRGFRERAARLQDALAENQWAGLDHDVKTATAFLLTRLPVPAALDRSTKTSSN